MNDSLTEMEASGDYDPRFTTKWTMPDGSKHEKAGNVVTAAILEKEFRQLDWSKPASGPSLAVERAGDNVLIIVLYPDATKSQERLWQSRRTTHHLGGGAISTLPHCSERLSLRRALAFRRA